MKMSIAIPMFLLAFLIALLIPSHSQGPEYCPTTLKIPGQCGSNANFECFLAVDGNFGASAMTKNCTCEALPNNERNCHCFIVCRE
ncbi:hypothetical protein DITRI_Ditri05aG0066700 [Diplodiscus trichospermus]